MQTMILGLPRNGKGLYAAQLGIDELVSGSRCIIGNFAWEKLPWVTKKHELRCGLLDYLDTKHQNDFNAAERIFRLTDEATSHFFLYRALSRKQVQKLETSGAHLVGYRQVTPLDNVMPPDEFRFHKDLQLYVCDHETRTDKNGRSVIVSFNPVLLEHSGGHLNIADECWRFWPARSWQSTSEADVFYSAQHGKFGDDCLFVTHRHNDIDSVIVDRCQQSVVLTHHGKLSFGIFRQPDIYSAKIYSGRPMPSKEPMSTKRFRLDAKGLGACYDTSAGVGVTGRGDADRGSRKTGVPFFVAPLIGFACLFLVLAVFHFGFGYIHRLFAKVKPPAHNAVAALPPQIHINAPVSLSEYRDVPVHGTNEIVCTGWVKIGNEYLAFTTDGNVYSSADHELDWIQKRKISILGKQYRIVRLPAFSEYQFEQQPQFEFAPAPERPVNQVSLTTIGNHYSAPRSSVSGFAAHAATMHAPLESTGNDLTIGESP